MQFPYLNELLDQDEYGEVFNSERTFTGLARLLEKHISVVIGWTDQEGSHLDILFVVAPVQAGGLQRGMSAQTDLFVAVSHFGMFGFEIKEDGELFAGYVGEKLRLGDNITTQKLAELIDGVRKRLV
jgi:hypothetical protein